MTTWSDLKSRIGLKANDASLQKASSTAYLTAANDAIVAFANSHTPNLSTSSLTPDSSTTTFDLPSDRIGGEDLYGVLYDGAWLEPMDTFPGSDSSPVISYFIWPHNQITFSQAPTSGRTLTIYYAAYYTELEEDEDELEVPRWAEEAITLYAAARMLELQAVKAANLGQFKQDTDSGRPEDNPLLKMATYYIEQYWHILSQHDVPRTRGL